MSTTTDLKVTVSGTSDTLVDGYTFVSGDWDVTIAATEGNDVAQFEALRSVDVTLDASEGDDTAAFEAAVSVSVSLDASEGDDTAEVSALVAVSSTIDATEGDDVAAFDVEIPIGVTLDATEGDDVAAFEAAQPARVTVDVSEGDDTAAFEATVHTAIEIAVSEADDTAAAFALNDWTVALDVDAQIYYVAVLEAGGEKLRLPISSWQATLQRDKKSFLQAVVPAAEDYIDDIKALTNPDLVVIRGARNLDDSEIEAEMARVPLGQMPYQRGPRNATVTLSGYGDITFTAVESDEAVGAERSLAGIRSLSTQGGTRVRSNVDWLLRPGMQAVADDQQFQVAYINYYVNVRQEFMDVGERRL